MKRFSAVVLVSMLCGVSVVHATNGTRMVGYTASALSRGGATFGVFQSPSIMMTNPAGLSYLPSSGLDVNFSLMVPALKFTNPLNSAEGDTKYFPLPGIAYGHNTPDGDLSWGIGAFTQGGMGADFSLKHALYRDQTGGYLLQEYHSQFAVMQGGPSLSYKIGPSFAIGVSAHIAYGQLEFSMPYSLSPSMMKGVVNPTNGMTFGDMFAGPPAQGGFGYSEVTASAVMKDLTAFGFSGKIGIAFKPTEKLSIGIAYTSSTPFTFKNGKAKMDMTAQLNDAFGKAMQGYMTQNPGATQQQAQAAVMAQFTGLGIDLTKGVIAEYDLEVTLTTPQSIGVGIGYEVTKEFRLAADAEWINWSSAFDKMGLSLSNGANPNINRMLGNSGSFTLDFPMNWKDAFAFRLGAEYDVIPALTLRAGYAFGSNPVPSSTVFPVFPAIVENHVMIGAGLKIWGPISFDAAYEIAVNKQLTAASPSLIAREYSGSTSELSENLFHVSLGWILE